MTIKEYAEDVNKSVEEILKHMERLGFSTDDLDRVLSDDEITLLDNSIQDEEDYVVDSDTFEELENDFELDEKAEKIAYDSNLAHDDSVRVTKVKSRPKNVDKANFKEARKKMYKNKV